MRLVNNWKNVLAKSSSVKLVAVAGAIIGAMEVIPEDAYSEILKDGGPWAAIAVMVAAIVARLIKQESISGKD